MRWQLFLLSIRRVYMYIHVSGALTAACLAASVRACVRTHIVALMDNFLDPLTVYFASG